MPAPPYNALPAYCDPATTYVVEYTYGNDGRYSPEAIPLEDTAFNGLRADSVPLPESPMAPTASTDFHLYDVTDFTYAAFDTFYTASNTAPRISERANADVTFVVRISRQFHPYSIPDP